MATRTAVVDMSVPADRLELGGRLIALAGLAVFLYGLMFLIIDFTSFIELGLSSQQVGGDASAIHSFSPALYNYISHLQVAISAFIMAFGLQLAALAWFGVRRGERWALWTAAVATALGYLVAVPLHFVYGFATVVHLGPFGVVAAVMIAGVWIAITGMPARAELRSSTRGDR
ncbi:MAG TPA: hypothetical protein VKT31_00620 [Solirubrobacteraceae bacterium]|nr:hypothetical protein [Solirubrobacteraceae bacterium]